MRTFNGLQIFTEQLTNSGQLDLRYVRISGNDSVPYMTLGARIGIGNNQPASSTSPGLPGQIALGSPSAPQGEGIYVCLSDGQWAFAPLIRFET
jgi:hypothetical protein